MERKLLRLILILAVLMTVGMAAYTMTAALRGERSSSIPLGTQAVSTQPNRTSETVSIDERLFPAQLAGMTRVQVEGGRDAISAVNQLHGLDIPLAAAYIVSYQGSGNTQMTIFYSEGKNEQDAAQLFKAMNEKMPANTVFKDYKTVQVEGKEYQFVTGMGQDHYYWQSGKRVLWVAIGGGNSADTLKQVAPLY